MRHINNAGLALIQEMEGLRLYAYQDSVGVWTIGYGHTPSHHGETVSVERATALLRSDILRAETMVNALTSAIDVSTTDNQFAAMVSLAFNIGTGAFRTSTVIRKHRAGLNVEAADAFLMWNKGHIDGRLVVIPGLDRRRHAERGLYLR